MKKITIGVTHSEARYENYPKWIKGDDADIEIIELSADDQNWDKIEDCDGILLTGGIDMHPQFYDSANLGILSPLRVLMRSATNLKCMFLKPLSIWSTLYSPYAEDISWSMSLSAAI
jgi:gamma-glutamyl-gamma-aminobutyrate hydrolase PuuD